MSLRPNDTSNAEVREQYTENVPSRLSKKDSTAFVNSIKYSAEPNAFLKQLMKKYPRKV